MHLLSSLLGGCIVKLTKKYGLCGGLISTVICAISSPTQHVHPTYTQASLLVSLCFEMGFMQTFLGKQNETKEAKSSQLVDHLANEVKQGPYSKASRYAASRSTAL